jgi:hypothetical protein
MRSVRCPVAVRGPEEPVYALTLPFDTRGQRLWGAVPWLRPDSRKARLSATPDKQQLLTEALAREGEAHRLLLEGEDESARVPLREAAELYRRSWESAGPRSFGRLIGIVKTSVLAGGGAEEAAYVRRELGDDADSPTGWYALALAALVAGDDELARRSAEEMREGGDAFARTADAIDALAAGERDRYAAALRAIVEDFETRDQHVTGVAIADTAAVLERVAAGRGIAAGVTSPLLPR